LLKALKLIPIISQSPFLKDKVYSLLLAFPELEDVIVNETTFQKLVYNRKTTPYREAIEIAAMLLLNYRPDISCGHNHVLAILFDMNDLWEEYIYRQLIRHKPIGWSIRPQHYKRFWESKENSHYKGVKPDVVITYNERCVIVDTKWKLPDRNIPDDSDLKQMFVYNEYWDGTHAVLLYPHNDFIEIPTYEVGTFKERDHYCGVMKMSVLCDPKISTSTVLDRTIGKRLNNFIETIFINETKSIS
jgi:5-methylcytosine-specific restriction enzyme subunit McrC